jgi:phosphoglycerol transferase
MQRDLRDHLYPRHRRRIFNVIINSAVSTENNRNRIFTTMDWFPTILASMGVTIEEDRLGIGTNLFSDTPTLAEEYGLTELHRNLAAQSLFYNSMLLP